MLTGIVRELGFELCGVVNTERETVLQHFAAFGRYLDAGMHGKMVYLADKREARRHPGAILPGVKSILMLGVSYRAVLQSQPHPVKDLTGIADYARGIDYHTWIRQRFKILAAKHRELFPGERCRGVVDTAPLLEKAFAAEAGLGFFGKNTLLINPQFGSKIFLAAFLSTAKFSRNTKGVRIPNEQRVASCGNCTKCLEACPTGALVAPYILDARRCVSYLTQYEAGGGRQEAGGTFATLPPVSGLLPPACFFGCDICQDVCPHNRHIPKEPPGTIDPFSLDSETLRVVTAGSPVKLRAACYE
jgi:epoxyqueuosine reductase